jgi:hypothetical protein
MTFRKNIKACVRAVGLGLAASAFVCARAGDDPFADVAALPAAPATAAVAEKAGDGWTDNLLFRKELYLLAGAGRATFDEPRDMMVRASAGFEVQKRFATATRTVASADYQGRVVYRDRVLNTAADPMGRGASPWKYETHNAYVDFYHLFGEPGRFNLRAGYFYQPFGLNWQTDTHATLLQLSNDRLFGSERDWQASLYGALTEDLDYTVGYLLGAGPDHEADGQTGMVAGRVALNNDWLFRHGLEGGASVAAGERVDGHAVMRSRSVYRATRGDPVVKTWRAGVDLRKRVDSSAGPFSLATETALGEDEDDLLASGLAQADWLHPSRRWGTALQYSHFWQDVGGGAKDDTEARATGVLTYYFKNDVGNANLHWIALAVERIVRRMGETEDTLLLVQYYRYW